MILWLKNFSLNQWISLSEQILLIWLTLKSSEKSYWFFFSIDFFHANNFSGYRHCSLVSPHPSLLFVLLFVSCFAIFSRICRLNFHYPLLPHHNFKSWFSSSQHKLFPVHFSSDCQSCLPFLRCSSQKDQLFANFFINHSTSFRWGRFRFWWTTCSRVWCLFLSLPQAPCREFHGHAEHFTFWTFMSDFIWIINCANNEDGDQLPNIYEYYKYITA